MDVTKKTDGVYFKGVVLDLSPVETLTVISALDTLHKDGGRNELDRVASKEMRQQIMSVFEEGR